MPRTPHLMTRRGRWYWRRRVAPEFRFEATAAAGKTCARGMLCLSLYTGERFVARQRAAALDAGFERWVMARVLRAAEPGSVSLAETMVLLRDHLIAEAEMAAADREPDEPMPRPGFQPVPVSETLLSQLTTFAEGNTGGEADLPADLAETAMAALAVVPRQPPGRPQVDGAGAARAAAGLGRARILKQAYVLNDQAAAAKMVPLIEELVGTAIPAQLHALLRRSALEVMAEVEREMAQRARGIRPDAALDPTMAMTLARVEVTPPVAAPPIAELPVATPPWVPAAPVASGASTETVSQIMTKWIEDSSKSRCDSTSEKTLRDRAVARDLFVEICGDLSLNQVTRAVCDDFVEQLMAVPAMHGRGEFADFTARQSLERADRMDQETEQKRGADGRTATVPRLAKGTINKHLSSLEGGLAKHMGLPPGSSSPIVQARFSKQEVEGSPAFVRRMPNDDLMRGMFHGPLFIGHDGSANRGAPGPHLEQDAK
ncbi:hypothetical protein [Belnapia rosea]|uniref:hypothetical protein n=1 Tax=Belnapia rosea TaxID=938405 RepID=UPI00088EC566|nr:hypothetical protein [Belnapia rosea]SDB75018.1 hypothetical protein SAMN02927895_05723 [Belnapia rosea]